MLALSVRAYRLLTDLGTVLPRKVTMRHLMTLLSSNDLFKLVCSKQCVVLMHPSCIFRMLPSCCGVKTRPDTAQSQEQKMDRNRELWVV